MPPDRRNNLLAVKLSNPDFKNQPARILPLDRVAFNNHIANFNVSITSKSTLAALLTRMMPTDAMRYILLLTDINRTTQRNALLRNLMSSLSKEIFKSGIDDWKVLEDDVATKRIVENIRNTERRPTTKNQALVFIAYLLEMISEEDLKIARSRGILVEAPGNRTYTNISDPALWKTAAYSLCLYVITRGYMLSQDHGPARRPPTMEMKCYDNGLFMPNRSATYPFRMRDVSATVIASLRNRLFMNIFQAHLMTRFSEATGAMNPIAEHYYTRYLLDPNADAITCTDIMRATYSCSASYLHAVDILWYNLFTKRAPVVAIVVALGSFYHIHLQANTRFAPVLRRATMDIMTPVRAENMMEVLQTQSILDNSRENLTELANVLINVFHKAALSAGGMPAIINALYEHVAPNTPIGRNMEAVFCGCEEFLSISLDRSPAANFVDMIFAINRQDDLHTDVASITASLTAVAVRVMSEPVDPPYMRGSRLMPTDILAVARRTKAVRFLLATATGARRLVPIVTDLDIASHAKDVYIEKIRTAATPGEWNGSIILRDITMCDAFMQMMAATTENEFRTSHILWMIDGGALSMAVRNFISDRLAPIIHFYSNCINTMDGVREIVANHRGIRELVDRFLVDGRLADYQADDVNAPQIGAVINIGDATVMEICYYALSNLLPNLAEKRITDGTSLPPIGFIECNVHANTLRKISNRNRQIIASEGPPGVRFLREAVLNEMVAYVGEMVHARDIAIHLMKFEEYIPSLDAEREHNGLGMHLAAHCSGSIVSSDDPSIKWNTIYNCNAHTVGDTIFKIKEWATDANLQEALTKTLIVPEMDRTKMPISRMAIRLHYDAAVEYFKKSRTAILEMVCKYAIEATNLSVVTFTFPRGQRKDVHELEQFQKELREFVNLRNSNPNRSVAVHFERPPKTKNNRNLPPYSPEGPRGSLECHRSDAVPSNYYWSGVIHTIVKLRSQPDQPIYSQTYSPQSQSRGARLVQVSPPSANASTARESVIDAELRRAVEEVRAAEALELVRRQGNRRRADLPVYNREDTVMEEVGRQTRFVTDRTQPGLQRLQPVSRMVPENSLRVPVNLFLDEEDDDDFLMA